MHTQTEQIEALALAALDDLKAKAIICIDVSSITSITDKMIVCSGTSTRHVKSIADNLARKAREAHFRVLGIEGAEQAEWVLVDLGDVIVHVMLPETREFYQLEKLWQIQPDQQHSQHEN